MFKKMLFALALICGISGCTNTYVHIINQGYSKTQINTLTEQLKTNGFIVKESKVKIPKTFGNSALAFNPSFTDFDQLITIETVLNNQSYGKPQHFSFAQGQHFYSDEHIGLYVRNEQAEVVTMPPYLRTQFCQSADATLMFADNGEFMLEYEENNYDEVLTRIVGKFSYDGRRLILIAADGISQQFQFSREHKATYKGDRPADVYKPKKKNNALKPFNCEFLIIYMD